MPLIGRNRGSIDGGTHLPLAKTNRDELDVEELYHKQYRDQDPADARSRAHCSPAERQRRKERSGDTEGTRSPSGARVEEEGRFADIGARERPVRQCNVEIRDVGMQHCLIAWC